MHLFQTLIVLSSAGTKDVYRLSNRSASDIKPGWVDQATTFVNRVWSLPKAHLQHVIVKLESMETMSLTSQAPRAFSRHARSYQQCKTADNIVLDVLEQILDYRLSGVLTQPLGVQDFVGTRPGACGKGGRSYPHEVGSSASLRAIAQELSRIRNMVEDHISSRTPQGDLQGADADAQVVEVCGDPWDEGGADDEVDTSVPEALRAPKRCRDDPLKAELWANGGMTPSQGDGH
eukprot:3167237-Amphidinium_carterae.2